MSFYYSLKRLMTKRILNSRKRFVEFNLKMNTRKSIKSILKNNKTPKLKATEVQAAKSYFKSKGYNLQNTYWHRYYKSLTNEFHKNYIPEDIFSAIISPQFNKMRQWPTLLDKNLSYNLFKDFKQPKAVVQNINGFYYVNDKIVDEAFAIETCNRIENSLVIKPTIDSGDGNMVNVFKVKDHKTTFKNLKISDVFKLYKEDFIVQEFVEQSEALKALNPTTLNTLRIMSYLKPDGVYILSSVLRIGQPNGQIDNFCKGGIVCGIDKNGFLKQKGYTRNGDVLTKTATNIAFKGYKIPNYNKVIEMVKTMHPIIPYFKFVSWDIGINKENSPVFIEYNTYYQDIDLHQITNGPLFGEFTDEILKLGLEVG